MVAVLAELNRGKDLDAVSWQGNVVIPTQTRKLISFCVT